MSDRGNRLPVRKTYKLYVAGAFPRSSGILLECLGYGAVEAETLEVGVLQPSREADDWLKPDGGRQALYGPPGRLLGSRLVGGYR